jgi:hypothetical protein
MTLAERGREGGVVSGVLRRDKILERVQHLPVDARVVEAYKQGYDAGYHAAVKRVKPRTAA